MYHGPRARPVGTGEGVAESNQAERIGPGISLAGRYEVGEAVGYGGMATVYRGRDTLLDRDVAVKVLNARLREDGADRDAFLREARAAAALVHPNVVAIYDAGVFAGWPYIVMEYVPGGTLKDLLDREGRLPPQRAVAIAAAMAEALDYGHRRGIVHADVKPGNILLDATGQPKLVDFGIAQTAAATVALTQAITGTAAYIAPEQLEGQPLDGRADIYALGTVLYQMLTGVLPFEAPNAATLATRRLVSAPRPIQELAPAIPPALAAVVMRCLARYPDDRFASANELARALRAIERGEPATEPTAPLRPPPPDERTQVWRREEIAVAPRRNLFPLVVTALGVVVVALAAVLGVLLLRGPGGSAVVPAVQGQLLDQAAQELHAAGLSIEVQIQPSNQPVGTVLSQNPQPNAHLAKKDPVQLVVSGGPAP